MKQDTGKFEDGTENKKDKKKKGGSALAAASVARSATDQVRRHSDADLASTGTNVSYEGATAPGGGGSVGSGYASGQPAVDSDITTNSEYEQAGAAPAKTKSNQDEAKNEREGQE